MLYFFRRDGVHQWIPVCIPYSNLEISLICCKIRHVYTSLEAIFKVDRTKFNVFHETKKYTVQIGFYDVHCRVFSRPAEAFLERWLFCRDWLAAKGLTQFHRSNGWKSSENIGLQSTYHAESEQNNVEIPTTMLVYSIQMHIVVFRCQIRLPVNLAGLPFKSARWSQSTEKIEKWKLNFVSFLSLKVLICTAVF